MLRSYRATETCADDRDTCPFDFLLRLLFSLLSISQYLLRHNMKINLTLPTEQVYRKRSKMPEERNVCLSNEGILFSSIVLILPIALILQH